MQGWISIHREIRSHWIWQQKPFSPGHAWIDMILRANHKSTKIPCGEGLIEIPRGSFLTSERTLREDWGWSTSKLRRFLLMLEKDSMIERKTEQKKSVIKIVNYRVFQDPESEKRAIKEQKKSDKRAKKERNNNNNNVYNDNNSRVSNNIGNDSIQSREDDHPLLSSSQNKNNPPGNSNGAETGNEDRKNQKNGNGTGYDGVANPGTNGSPQYQPKPQCPEGKAFTLEKLIPIFKKRLKENKVFDQNPEIEAKRFIVHYTSTHWIWGIQTPRPIGDDNIVLAVEKWVLNGIANGFKKEAKVNKNLKVGEGEEQDDTEQSEYEKKISYLKHIDQGLLGQGLELSVFNEKDLPDIKKELDKPTFRKVVESLKEVQDE